MSKTNYLIVGALLALTAFVALIVSITRGNLPAHQSPEHMERMRKAAAKKRKENKATNGTSMDQGLSEGQTFESETEDEFENGFTGGGGTDEEEDEEQDNQGLVKKTSKKVT